MAAESIDEFVESELDRLEIYFYEAEWKELSDYEKKIFATIKRNCENLVAIGKITIFFNLYFL